MTRTLTFIEALQEGASSESIFKAVESGVLEIVSYDEDGLPSFYQDHLKRINGQAGPGDFRETVVNALQKRADRLSSDADAIKSVADKLFAENDVKVQRKIVSAGTIEPFLGAEFDLKESEIDAGV
jgi:hypothetical protein